MTTTLSAAVQLTMLARAHREFTPLAPITTRDRFIGRRSELSAILAAVAARGRHVAVVGADGLGKTSLAAVSLDLVSDGPHRVCRVSCRPGESFADVWARAAAGLRMTLLSDPEPSDIVAALATLGPCLIAFDDVHQIEDADAFPHVLAGLTTTDADCTLILTTRDGLNDIDLLGDSVEWVLLGSMPDAEVSELLSSGFVDLGHYVEPEDLAELVRLAGGLPGEAHRLALATITGVLRVV
ncbi:MAG: hypothetical protein KDB23_28205 [Planctomycetales bacterium]|nr:hypothetical protein [Planctomycetales bacterium]